MDTTTQRIRELRAMGLTYSRIAAYLNRKSVRPAKAESWTAMMVRNVHERAKDNEPG